MQIIEWGGIEFTLGEDLVWRGADPVLTDSLNSWTAEALQEYGPAAGTPRGYVFSKMVELLGVTIVVNEVEEEEEPPGEIEY